MSCCEGAGCFPSGVWSLISTPCIPQSPDFLPRSPDSHPEGHPKEQCGIKRSSSGVPCLSSLISKRCPQEEQICDPIARMPHGQCFDFNSGHTGYGRIRPPILHLSSEHLCSGQVFPGTARTYLCAQKALDSDPHFEPWLLQSLPGLCSVHWGKSVPFLGFGFHIWLATAP